VKLSRVLDLTDPATRATLGIDLPSILEEDSATAREIGEAANYLGFEAILAPSASGEGSVLAILMTNRAADSELVVEPRS
jgi:RES domain-containing protein